MTTTTRPRFVREFLHAVDAHRVGAVHEMFVAQAHVLATYIRDLERPACGGLSRPADADALIRQHLAGPYMRTPQISFVALDTLIHWALRMEAELATKEPSPPTPDLFANATP